MRILSNAFLRHGIALAFSTGLTISVLAAPAKADLGDAATASSETSEPTTESAPEPDPETSATPDPSTPGWQPREPSPASQPTPPEEHPPGWTYNDLGDPLPEPEPETVAEAEPQPPPAPPSLYGTDKPSVIIVRPAGFASAAGPGKCRNLWQFFHSRRSTWQDENRCRVFDWPLRK